MRLHLTAAVAAALLVPLAAMAQACGPNTFLDAFRQADAAYARKDVAAATAALRPLAEQGLGPAQLRLGQALSESGGNPDEAYLWIALAADVGTPGAKDALAKLEPKVDAAARAQAKPAGWQPKLGPCLSVDPRQKDGGAYASKLLINNVFTKAGSGEAPPQLSRWLTDSLEYVRTKSPRHLVYLKSLAGIGFRDRGPLVVVDARDGLPILVFNEELALAPDGKSARSLTDAAVYAVHKHLIPAVVTFETQTYKGRTIRFPATDEGRKFVAVMKQAIDMAEGLPLDLAKEARAVADIRYEPREPYDKRGGALAPGDIARDPATKQRYMAYAEIFELRGPSMIVLNLTSAGIRARRADEYYQAQLQLEEARKRNATADVEKAERRMTEIKNIETGVDKRGFCELLDNGIKTMEALKLDPIDINREYKKRFSRGCA